MRAALIVAFVASCGTAPPPVQPGNVATPETIPDIRFAVLDGAAGTLRFFAVAPGRSRLVVERELAVGDQHELSWAGSALAMTHYEDGAPVIELVGARGGSATPLPDIAWPSVEPNAGEETSAELRAFTSGAQSQLVVARCTSKAHDGYEAIGACTTWQYARFSPAPAAVLADAPDEDAELPLPKVVPSKVAAVVDAERGRVRCTDARGVVHELAPPEQGALSVAWLVADPPIFRVDTVAGSGFGPGYVRHQIYEGCELSRRYRNAFAGPHDELVLAGASVDVYWHGHLVARDPSDAPGEPTGDADDLAHALRVAFAPR